MKHDWKKAIGILVLGSLLASCSAKVEGGDAPAAPYDIFGSKPRVDGPAVQGKWESLCVADFSRSQKWTLTFESNGFSRVQETFEGQNCEKSKVKTTYSGLFIFSKQYTDGSYEINYAVSLGAGVTQFLDEKLLLEDDTLYISDMIPGELAAVIRSVPMRTPSSPEGLEID